ncbi:WXG100 family type VII secretion target [Nocardioides campestrisoli]|uniref:WXG100 family type VII secretion target n=1 Tax=Nocardioides campestrisoli TaxID=2736757 RepID=UPI0015E656C7|nr:WXG100 family type VII secretion target [Nocardioides campestrisoli]
MTVNLTHDSMRRAIAALAKASHQLAEDSARADLRVTAFLDSGWSGVAAERFDEAWQEWKTAAEQVQDGLTSMSELVKAAHADLVHQDDESQRRLDSLAQRLVDRLG